MSSRILVVVVVLAAIIAYLAHYIEHDRGDMDKPSYLFSKLMNIAFLPKTYPSDARNAKLWRTRMGRAKKKSSSYEFSGSTRDVELYASDGTSLPARIYQPVRDADSSSLLPVVVWIHGGGWVIGDIDIDHLLAAKVAAYAGMVVVSVSYRMAPEHVFPAAADDVQQALQWVKASIHAYGGDAEEVYVAGESSGGNLAAAVTSLNLDTVTPDRVSIKGSVLVYPPLASECNFTSFAEYDSTSLLSAAQMDRFWDVYAGSDDISVRQNYLYAPFWTPRHILQQYPPTSFLVAKYDVLADDSMQFAAKLRQEGVTVGMQVFAGSTHGFLGVDELPRGDEAVFYVAKELVAMHNSISKA